MKRLTLFLILLTPSITLADCSVSDVIQTIRPGATWSVTNNDVATLVWSSTQTIPSKAEVTQAMLDCRTQASARIALKQQARLDVKNTLLTPAQRLQALLILLDYDQ